MKTSGNIYVMLFGAAVMAGIVGMSAQKYVMNPLKTASNVTRKNAAETQMQLGLRVAATNAVTQQGSSGDCDSDGLVEPMPYVDAGANPHPSGGGYLPTTTGGVQIDPWNTRYGYCVWDHGSAVDAAGCGGASQLRLPGTNGEEWKSMAVISAGPDKVFQTTCNAWADVDVNNIPDTPLLNRPNGSDDVYYAWSYQEADVSSGLWTAVGATGAQISKNLSVKDGSNNEQLSFNSTTAALALGSAGRARMPTVSTDYVQTLTSPSILLRHGLMFFPEDGSGTSYYLQNPTGDNFVMSPNTTMRQVFDSSGISMYPNPTSSRGAMFAYASSAMRLTLRGDSTDYHSGIELESTFTGASVTLNKQMFIAGKHQAADGNNDYTSRIVFGQAVGGGATPTSSDLAGYISFQTRPSGLALNGALNEMMRIHETGNVTMGSVHTPNANKLKTNIGLFATNGNVGIGTTTPATALDVNGNMILGSTGGACNVSRAPMVRYNPSLKCLQYCFTDGLWKCANFSACATTLPAVFTPTTSSTVGNVYTSTIHQITGIGTCNAMVGVSGLGTPQFQICSDAACSTVVQSWTNVPYAAQNGQYVQLRNTIAQSGVTFKTSLTVGSRTYQWTNTTSGDCSAPSPPAGTFCEDGTIYVGLSPDGNTKMYTTPCAFGRSFDPQTFTCQGALQTMPWANGATIATGINNDTTGQANTTALAGLVNADSPYYAAQLCQNMVAHGKSDWYLPSVNEAGVIVATCATHPETDCTSNTAYWTSREHHSVPTTNARAYRFSGATNIGIVKTNPFTSVLCVRKYNSCVPATWTARTEPGGNPWQAVVYGNGLFVAIGDTGTPRVITSPDGITWTGRTAPTLSWNRVTYGNGLFVAVSNDGTERVMTSPDGITWTGQTAAQNNSWRDVVYGNGLFVAVSDDGANRVMTSPNGVTWTARTVGANTWSGVTYANGVFVAVSYSNAVTTSPDGITWTARTAPDSNDWSSVAYGNGVFVAVARTGTNRVMTSPDGITWTARTAAENNDWRRVTYGDGVFVAVSSNGTSRVMTSPDGITWTARAAAQANSWRGVTYGNGRFVAVSADGTNRVMTSDCN